MTAGFVRRVSTRLLMLFAVGLLSFASGCGRNDEQAAQSQASAPAQPAVAEECSIAVQLYSFRNDLDRDLPGTLARIKELGIDCVEPYSLHGRTPEELRAEFDRAGLKVVSFHLPGDLYLGPPEQAVHVGQVLGAKQIGVAWIKESETDAVDEAKLMAAAERLNSMCSAAQAAGMNVFYHTHGYEFHEGDAEGAMFDRFVNALTPDCVVLQLDVYWVAFAGQDPVELLKRYGERTLSLHVKDMPENLPVGPLDGSQWKALGDEAFAIPGQGKLDWPALLDVAKASAVRWYIIEDETSRPMENAAAVLAYLRSQGL